MRLFAGAWRVGERMEHILTSEAVTRGHPDKVCDQIADALLDAVLAEDPEARAACEAAVWENRVWLFGELTAQQGPDYEAVVREVLRDIGYDRPELGLDAETCDIQVHFHPQSPDIARGVSHRAAEDTGAGDQGIMAGYACRETAERMPLPITLANRLAKRLEAVRQEGILPWLRPDGKAQVSVAYRDGVPVGITTVVLSAQHDPDITVDDLREALRQEVVLPVLPAELVREDTLLYITPTGRFVTGGPAADSGLTGRKPLADTYGSAARYGGGSLSGKDPTKADRTGAYLARYLAKNIVEAGLADRCEVQLAYAIGVAKPMSVRIDTFGTAKVAEGKIAEAVNNVFDLRPAAIIRDLDLRRPIYKQTAAYGHFGREDLDLSWEKTDRVEALQALCK